MLAEMACAMVARGKLAHELGRQTVAELGIEVVSPDHAFGELGPGVGVLIGEPRARLSRRSCRALPSPPRSHRP